jgi:hypothetical protein
MFRKVYKRQGGNLCLWFSGESDEGFWVVGKCDEGYDKAQRYVQTTVIWWISNPYPIYLFAIFQVLVVCMRTNKKKNYLFCFEGHGKEMDLKKRTSRRTLVGFTKLFFVLLRIHGDIPVQN